MLDYSLKGLFHIASAFPYSAFASIVFVIFVIVFIRWNKIVVDFAPERSPEQRLFRDHRLPPDYPNGWIPILESHVLKANQIQSVPVLGRELAVARTQNGNVHVFDAFCPHLGANLAVGGTVHRQKCSSGSQKSEDCVRCPFHGWSFRLSDGTCSDVPYESSPPKGADLKIWRSLECNGTIFVWFHAEDEEPTWFPEVVPEIASGEWVYRTETVHYVNCHIQDIPENGPDVAHLNEIHADSFMLGSDLSWTRKFKALVDSFGHYFTARWEACHPPKEHIAEVDFHLETRFFGFKLLNMDIAIQQIGPAYVELRYKTNFLFGLKGIIIQQVTPIGPMRNCLRHLIFTERGLFGFIFARFFMFSEAKLLERDIQIWNRKAFLSRPHLVKSERSIARYRRWYSQFYSNNTPQKILSW